MMKITVAISAASSYDSPIFPPTMLKMVAVALTWAATVPIITRAIRTDRSICGTRPKRMRNRSGMEVAPYCLPTRWMRPAIPEKI